MALKYVDYCSPFRLPCAGSARSEVVLCLQSGAVLADPLSPYGGLECAFADATICQFYSLTSCPSYWHYRFSYDEEILADPLVTLTTGDIVGVFCRDCQTDWVECQVGNILSNLCFGETETLTLELVDTCISGNVKVSADEGNAIEIREDGLFAESGGGGGGNDWHILGNSDIVDGTNFLGTTNDVAVTIRVNDLKVFRFESGTDSDSPNTTGGNSSNTISGSPSVLNFIGSGSQNSITDSIAGCIGGGSYNSIQALTEPWELQGYNFIGAGYAHFIRGSDYNTIGGGLDNIIEYFDYDTYDLPNASDYIAYDTIAGGVFNEIGAQAFEGADVPPELGANFIGGGNTNFISNGLSTVICGGLNNLVESSTQDNMGPWTANFIGSGDSNYFGNSTYSSIVGGLQNSITDSSFSFIGGGGYDTDGFAVGNLITNGRFSTICGGGDNIIIDETVNPFDNPGFSIICGGNYGGITQFNDLDPSYVSNGQNCIVGGQGQEITSGNGDFLGGGYFNSISHWQGVLYFAGYDAIVGGESNEIRAWVPYGWDDLKVDSPLHNFVGGGYANGITNSESSTIAGGNGNGISYKSFFVFPSTVNPPVNGIKVYYDTISGGINNNILGSASCYIGGGVEGAITGQGGSGVISGQRNTIDSDVADYIELEDNDDGYYDPAISIGNVILGGSDNAIYGGNCSSILGGANLKIGFQTLGYQNSSQTSQVDVSAFSGIGYLGDIDLWLANTDNTARKLKFFSPNTDLDFSSSLYSSFQAQAQTGSIEYILPNGQASDYSVGDTLKIQNISGNVITLEWS